MDLYLLRHAIAGERGSGGYSSDHERPLTPKGRKKMRRIAEGMLAMDLSFDQIISSPFTRARQTAEIVARVFECEELVTFSKHLEVGGNPSLLVREIQQWYSTCESIILVGHEPYLSTFVSRLISGSDDLRVTMKKGGLCKLSLPSLHYSKCATLEWLLTPAQLVRMS